MGKEHTSPQIPTLDPSEQAAVIIETYLRKHYNDSLAEEASALWKAFHHKQPLRFRKALSHAAAFLCAFLRLRLTYPPQQQAILKELQISTHAVARLISRYHDFLSLQLPPPQSKRSSTPTPTPPTIQPIHLCTAAPNDPFLEQEQDFLQYLHTLHPRSQLPVPPRYTVQSIPLNHAQYNPLRRLPQSDETWIVGVFAPPPFSSPQRDADLCALWMIEGHFFPLSITYFSSKDSSFVLPFSFLDTTAKPQIGSPRLPKRVWVSQRNILRSFKDFFSPLGIEVLHDGQEDFTRLACTFFLPTTQPRQIPIPPPNSSLSPHTLTLFHQTTTQLFDALQQQPIPCCTPFGFDLTPWGGPRYIVCTFETHPPISHLMIFSSAQDLRLFSLLQRAPYTLSTLRLPPIHALLLRFASPQEIPPSFRELHPTLLHTAHPTFSVLCEWSIHQQQSSHATPVKHEHAIAIADAFTQLLKHPAHPTTLSSLRSLDLSLALPSFPSRPPISLQFPHRSAPPS